MTIIPIRNPFGAPVYHKETLTSTMDISRKLAANGEPHGAVITADFQHEGRGRVRGRVWQMDGKVNLPFTILLRYPCAGELPQALTLRAGLAVSLAIEDFSPFLKNRVLVKWPNDIMIDGKKTAGLLCEANGGDAHVGIGVNVAQKFFPVELRDKATSIALASNTEIAAQERFILLEKILFRLYNELEGSGGAEWKARLEIRLYKKGERVKFIEGAADSGKEVTGTLTGIGENGGLLITPNGETEPRVFITGELVRG